MMLRRSSFQKLQQQKVYHVRRYGWSIQQQQHLMLIHKRGQQQQHQEPRRILYGVRQEQERRGVTVASAAVVRFNNSHHHRLLQQQLLLPPQLQQSSSTNITIALSSSSRIGSIRSVVANGEVSKTTSLNGRSSSKRTTIASNTSSGLDQLPFAASSTIDDDDDDHDDQHHHKNINDEERQRSQVIKSLLHTLHGASESESSTRTSSATTSSMRSADPSYFENDEDDDDDWEIQLVYVDDDDDDDDRNVPAKKKKNKSKKQSDASTAEALAAAATSSDAASLGRTDSITTSTTQERPTQSSPTPRATSWSRFVSRAQQQQQQDVMESNKNDTNVTVRKKPMARAINHDSPFWIQLESTQYDNNNKKKKRLSSSSSSKPFHPDPLQPRPALATKAPAPTAAVTTNRRAAARSLRGWQQQQQDHESNKTIHGKHHHHYKQLAPHQQDHPTLYATTTPYLEPGRAAPTHSKYILLQQQYQQQQNPPSMIDINSDIVVRSIRASSDMEEDQAVDMWSSSTPLLSSSSSSSSTAASATTSFDPFLSWNNPYSLQEVGQQQQQQQHEDEVYHNNLVDDYNTSTANPRNTYDRTMRQPRNKRLDPQRQNQQQQQQQQYRRPRDYQQQQQQQPRQQQSQQYQPPFVSRAAPYFIEQQQHIPSGQLYSQQKHVVEYQHPDHQYAHHQQQSTAAGTTANSAAAATIFDVTKFIMTPDQQQQQQHNLQPFAVSAQNDENFQKVMAQKLQERLLSAMRLHQIDRAMSIFDESRSRRIVLPPGVLSGLFYMFVDTQPVYAYKVLKYIRFHHYPMSIKNLRHDDNGNRLQDADTTTTTSASTASSDIEAHVVEEVSTETNVSMNETKGKNLVLHMYKRLCRGVRLLDPTRVLRRHIVGTLFPLLEDVSLMSIEDQKVCYPFLLASLVEQRGADMSRQAHYVYQYMVDHQFNMNDKYLEHLLLRSKFTRQHDLPFHDILRRLVDRGTLPLPSVVMHLLQNKFPYTDVDATASVLMSIIELQKRKNSLPHIDQQQQQGVQETSAELVEQEQEVVTSNVKETSYGVDEGNVVIEGETIVEEDDDDTSIVASKKSPIVDDYVVDVGMLQHIAAGAARLGKPDLVLLVWDLLDMMGLQPTESIYESTIHSFIKARMQDENAFSVLAEMEAKGFPLSRALTRSLSLSLRYSRARMTRSYRIMAEKGEHSLGSMNVFMSTCAELDDAEVAFATLNDFSRFNITPNTDSLTYALESIANEMEKEENNTEAELAKFVAVTGGVLNMFDELGLKLNHHFIHEYARILCRAREVETATQVLLQSLDPQQQTHCNVLGRTINMVAIENAKIGQFDVAKNLLSKSKDSTRSAMERIENMEKNQCENMEKELDGGSADIDIADAQPENNVDVPDLAHDDLHENTEGIGLPRWRIRK